MRCNYLFNQKQMLNELKRAIKTYSKKLFLFISLIKFINLFLVLRSNLWLPPKIIVDDKECDHELMKNVTSLLGIEPSTFYSRTQHIDD